MVEQKNANLEADIILKNKDMHKFAVSTSEGEKKKKVPVLLHVFICF
jgi:hypothetical protein